MDAKTFSNGFVVQFKLGSTAFGYYNKTPRKIPEDDVMMHTPSPKDGKENTTGTKLYFYVSKFGSIFYRFKRHCLIILYDFVVLS